MTSVLRAVNTDEIGWLLQRAGQVTHRTASPGFPHAGMRYRPLSQEYSHSLSAG